MCDDIFFRRPSPWQINVKWKSDEDVRLLLLVDYRFAPLLMTSAGGGAFWNPEIVKKIKKGIRGDIRIIGTAIFSLFLAQRCVGHMPD
jgi:hypothetical protein